MRENLYDPMPADFGDDGEVKSLVGTPVAPEPTKDADPDIEIELAGAPKRRPAAKKAAQKAEDEQGTTAKD